MVSVEVPFRETGMNARNASKRTTQYPTGEELKVVWTESSTLSLTVLLNSKFAYCIL
jgi:hypothetical protein